MNSKGQEEEYVCEHCGADVSVNDMVCPKCGADISEVDEDSDENVFEEDAIEPVDVFMPDGKTIKQFKKPKDPLTAMLQGILPGVWQLCNKDRTKGLIGIICFVAIPITYAFLYNFLAPFVLVFAELTLIVWSMADAYKTADQVNVWEHYRYQYSLKKLKDGQQETATVKNKNTMTSADFIDSIQKCHRLLTSTIYSREEFSSCKMKHIKAFDRKQMADSPDDFLTSIVSLSTEGILSKDELAIIKQSILTREKEVPKKEQERSIQTNDFIETMRKFGNLHENGVFSEDEYKGQKLKLINNLEKGILKDTPVDFLTAIVPLVKDKIISDEELGNIKKILLR